MALGGLNIKHLIVLRKVKLYPHFFLAHNSFLCDVFSVFLLHNLDNGPMLKTVFWTAPVLMTMFEHCFKAVLMCNVFCLSVALPTSVINVFTRAGA